MERIKTTEIDKKLFKEVSAMGLEIVKSIVKNCPEHDKHHKNDIVLNVLVSAYINFILNNFCTG